MAGALVRRYWRALEARDWPAFASTLADHVVYELPQTRERVRGRAAYVDFNRTFPGAWHIEPIRLVAEDGAAFGQIALRDGDLRMTALTYFEVEAAHIVRLEEYWPEPYEPPSRASRFVERF